MEQFSNLNDISLSLTGALPLAIALALLVPALRRADNGTTRLPDVSTTTLLTIIALTVAVMALVCSCMRYSVLPPGGHDGYFPRAVNLVRSGVFGAGSAPGARYPPGYSVLMVPAVWIFGESRWVFFSTNMALLAGCSTAVSFMLRGAGLAPGRANLVALVLFLYPNRLFSTLLPFSDIPFSLVYLLAFLFAVRAAQEPARTVLPVASGVLAGIAALIRPAGILLLVPLVICLLPPSVREPAVAGAKPRPTLFHARGAGLLAAAALLVLLPWTLRNYIRFGQLIPVASSFGYNLAIGNNPASGVTHNGYIDSLAQHPAAWRKYGGDTTWNVAQMDTFLLRKGAEFIRDHPGLFITRGAGKVVHTFASDASTFGMHETYGNLRTIDARVAGALHAGPLPAAGFSAAYGLIYRALFVVNNALYYLTCGLLFVLLFRRRYRWSGADRAYLAAVIITAALVFVLFGISRFKEPIPPLTLILLALRTSPAEPRST